MVYRPGVTDFLLYGFTENFTPLSRTEGKIRRRRLNSERTGARGYLIPGLEKERLQKGKKGVKCICSSWNCLYRHLFIRTFQICPSRPLTPSLSDIQTPSYLCYNLLQTYRTECIWRKAVKQRSGSNHRGMYWAFFSFFFKKKFRTNKEKTFQWMLS